MALAGGGGRLGMDNLGAIGEPFVSLGWSFSWHYWSSADPFPGTERVGSRGRGDGADMVSADMVLTCKKCLLGKPSLRQKGGEGKARDCRALPPWCCCAGIGSQHSNVFSGLNSLLNSAKWLKIIKVIWIRLSILLPFIFVTDGFPPLLSGCHFLCISVINHSP